MALSWRGPKEDFYPLSGSERLSAYPKEPKTALMGYRVLFQERLPWHIQKTAPGKSGADRFVEEQLQSQRVALVKGRRPMNRARLMAWATMRC